ncbi:hypothetical protein [Nocardia macrotermitis]|uniref:Uncharacterized protein n=1 Tax=Nocardia macrotermitis TaxID=2585198 RepID=A0A7K0D7K5_9NOCA|nr:hypothetical protein [Nocardia macrotermitis]MQY21736.1 hypothetical protein [Nocardia macrotermitis]
MGDANSMIDMKQQFTNYANSAASGQLIIEDGVADKCIQHCQNYLVDLNALKFRCSELVHVASFGTLKSASALGNKFHTLAIGDTGTGSLKEAIQERIDVVMQMEEMFKKAKDAFTSSDEATKDKLRQAMNKIDK